MGVKSKALRAAFPQTIPVLAGYAFLGMAFGIYINSAGFPFWYPMIMSVAIYAGSMQFVAVGLMLMKFDPVGAFMLTLMVNARHLFYGLSMLEKLRGTGKKGLYIIFGMTDETFTINYAATPPSGVDRSWFYFFITLLDHLYWITASTVGGIAGSFIPFDTTGIDFVMTALFMAILVDQWCSQKCHAPAVTGVAASVICLTLFGADNFIIPAMLLILLGLTLSRRRLEKEAACA